MPVLAADVQVGLGGQYRVNAYAVDDDILGADDQRAARLRIRQNIDLKFDPQFKTHLQIELGHTTDNIDTTNSSTRGTRLAVRHAVLDYTFTNGVHAQAGIVPLADHFGDALFSSDWNYNPLAYAGVFPVGGGTLRVFAAKLNEGQENITEDDFSHYQLDYRLALSGKHEINLGAAFVRLAPSARPNTDPPTTPFASGDHVNLGLGARVALAGGLTLNAFAVASRTDRELLGTADDGRGTAVKLELTGALAPGRFGLLATHATGKRDHSGFLPVMALARTNGYWGYTGILTVQGPTDTGFDGDSVNVSNNGYGLSTIQARYVFPVTPSLSANVAAGWFGNAKTPAGRGEVVGTDVLLMGTYRFSKELALDFGVDRAKIKDAASGYSNGVTGGASFNQAAGVARDKTAFFTRLQAEF
jgi:hypothetical protein